MNVEHNLVFGTAGHIDHGKTSLVRTMTGIDTDRLQEEKKRGISIELGFAPLTLPCGKTVSIIDVPGHERFIRQMTAGASGIDAVIFVVAGDEGIMPQTREHLDILTLLGIKRGVVAVTKKDIVDEELLELVHDDLREYLKGTFLESAPVLDVASTTGEGISQLVEELNKIALSISPRSSAGPFLLGIDRIFTMSGFGTVVTGTSYSGSVKEGESLELLPKGMKLKVRQIQVHGAKAVQALAGQRVALNMSGVSVTDIERGDYLASCGMYRATTCLDVTLKVLPSWKEPLVHWQRVHIYMGAAELLGRIALFEGEELTPGNEAMAQIVLENPTLAYSGQNFVIRQYSPLMTIGGGSVLFAYARRNRQKKSREQYIVGLRDIQKSSLYKLQFTMDRLNWCSVHDLMIASQIWPPEFHELFGELKKSKYIYSVDIGEGICLSLGAASRLAGRAKEVLKRYHAIEPLSGGIRIDDLRGRVAPGLDSKAWRALLESLFELAELRVEGELVSHISHNSALLGDSARIAASVEKAIDKAWYEPLAVKELQDILKLEKPSDVERVVRSLAERGKIVDINGLLFSCRVIEDAKERIKKIIQQESSLTLARFRDEVNSSRKFILPLLEYLDGIGFTRRVGDKRILGRNKA